MNNTLLNGAMEVDLSEIMKYKVGDRVVCISGDILSDIEEGELFTVQGGQPMVDGIVYALKRDNEDTMVYSLDRFELFEEDEPLSFCSECDEQIYNCTCEEEFWDMEDDDDDIWDDDWDDDVMSFTEMMLDDSDDIEETPEEELINHPIHYMHGGIETIDFIQAKLTEEQFKGYLMGNVIKYMGRCNFKGNLEHDLRKAQFYNNKIVELEV